jgi:hypothetical protein
MAKLYSITDEELIKEFNRRFEYTMISKKNIKYEVPAELWEIIKEYAGIYHIGTDWFKLEKIGIITIHDHFKNEYRRRISNVNKDVLDSKRIIFKSIFKKYKTKDNLIKLYELITDKYPKNKVLDIKCKVGDQICYHQLVGVVTKINKTTISFKPYKIDRVVREDPDVFNHHSFENIRYYFNKNKFEKVKTVKHFKLDNSDYFEKIIDWGR